jgi:hypothetical protein
VNSIWISKQVSAEDRLGVVRRSRSARKGNSRGCKERCGSARAHRSGQKSSLGGDGDVGILWRDAVDRNRVRRIGRNRKVSSAFLRRAQDTRQRLTKRYRFPLELPCYQRRRNSATQPGGRGGRLALRPGPTREIGGAHASRVDPDVKQSTCENKGQFSEIPHGFSERTSRVVNQPSRCLARPQHSLVCNHCAPEVDIVGSCASCPVVRSIFTGHELGRAVDEEGGLLIAEQQRRARRASALPG